jgi:hypothetical protein
MAEIRKFDFSKIYAHVPDIPENWYVPAKDLWKMTAWCFMQLRNKNYVRNDKDMEHFVRRIEEWIEEHAVSMEEER